MKIIKLQAENIKRIKAIEIKPDANLVQITGANAQGKTSVLDSIWYALGGTSTVGANPIRDNEEKASIVVELDDLLITRRFKRKEGKTTSTLLVENKKGLKHNNPQSLLNTLVGKLSFDPLSFCNLKTKEQVNLLCDVCGVKIDFDELERKKQNIYDERTLINREMKALENNCENIQIDPNLPTEKRDIQELASTLKEIIQQNAFQRENTEKINNLKIRQDEIINTIKNLKEELQIVEVDINERTLQWEDEIDVSMIKHDIENVEKINNNADNYIRREELKEKLTQKISESSCKTMELADIDNFKINTLKNAKMPLPGISIDSKMVYYNGIPFEQLSSSEKLIISLNIAVAANPTLKIIRITDGSLLDNKAMETLLNFANTKDFQIWIERVDESGNVGICIEDGMIKN